MDSLSGSAPDRPNSGCKTRLSRSGDGLFGWEPRYDRCRCQGFWPRTRHAIIRNFVTYNRTEKSLRRQIFPYLGAFVGNVTATAWTPAILIGK
jgi:hypothetical protein